MHRDGKTARWDDESRHRAAFASDPEFYTLCAFVEGIRPWQQARILLLLLTESRRDLSRLLCAHYERITLFLLATLSIDLALTVFLAVRRARANHKHTVRAVLSYLLQHPDIEALALLRPRAIRDCLEHALGKAQFRHFGYHAPRRGREAPVPSLLRRYAGSEGQIRRLAAILNFGESGNATSHAPVRGREAEHDRAASEILVPLLRQFYRVGTSPELVREVEAAIVRCAAGLPEIPGRIALILDASVSMRGSGKQEFAPIALAVAFERVLQAKCPGLRSYTIGGFGWPPAPEGPTDFGRVLIDALEAEPEVVLILTDGCENANEGDAVRIVATLRSLGISTPVVCCRVDNSPHPAPSEGLPAFPLRQEGEFGATMQIIDLLTAHHAARERVADALRMRQTAWETEVYAWIVGS